MKLSINPNKAHRLGRAPLSPKYHELAAQEFELAARKLHCMHILHQDPSRTFFVGGLWLIGFCGCLYGLTFLIGG